MMIYSSTLFYLVIIILSLFLFFKGDNNIYFKGIMIIIFVTTFFFLVITTQTLNYVDYDNPQAKRTIGVDGVDLNDMDLINDALISSTLFHFQELDLDCKYIANVHRVEACFYYNNTDDTNVVYFGYLNPNTESTTHIGKPMYIPNETTGKACSVINISILKENSWFGLHCDDCSVGNTLYWFQDNNADIVTEIELNEGANAKLGDILTERSHAIEFNLQYVPVDEIQSRFYFYLFFLGMFILMLGTYFSADLMIKLIKKI